MAGQQRAKTEPESTISLKIGDRFVGIMARRHAKRPKRHSQKRRDEVYTYEQTQTDAGQAMSLLEHSPAEDCNPYHYQRADSQSSWGSSGQSNATSPMEGALNDMFAYLTPNWETTCFDIESNTKTFEETAAALKSHKDSTRRAQNRSAQRAYRERQQSRLKEMQGTIEDLTSDRDNLRSRIKDLESDLHRVKMDATIQSIKLERRHTQPVAKEQQRPKRRPVLAQTLSNDGVGWMLKHIYGLDEAEDEMFAVFEVKSG